MPSFIIILQLKKWKTEKEKVNYDYNKKTDEKYAR